MNNSYDPFQSSTTLNPPPSQTESQKILLKRQKYQMKNKNNVNLICNSNKIPRLFSEIRQDLKSIYKKLQRIDLLCLKKNLYDHLLQNIKVNVSLDQIGEYKKETLSSSKYQSNIIISTQRNFNIFITQDHHNLYDLELIRKIQKYKQLMTKSQLQIVKFYLTPLAMQNSIQNSIIQQQRDPIQKQKQNKDSYFFSFLQDRLKIIKKKYQENVKKYSDYANIQTLNKNIFNNLDFVLYLPSMIKVTLLNVDKMEKINQLAEVSIKVQIKVNLPGFSNSPAFYESLIREYFQITINNENLAGEGAVSVKFTDENSKLSFYSNPLKYYETAHDWGAYDFEQNLNKQRLDDFDGFLIVAELNQLKVKVIARQFFSPFQLLDLCGIIQIKPIRIPLIDLKNLILFSQPQLLNLLYKANPNFTIKFNLIDLYNNNFKNSEVKISPEIFMNHINTTEKILIDGYNSAPNLMLMQLSGESNKKAEYQIPKDGLFCKCGLGCLACLCKWKSCKCGSCYQCFHCISCFQCCETCLRCECCQCCNYGCCQTCSRWECCQSCFRCECCWKFSKTCRVCCEDQSFLCLYYPQRLSKNESRRRDQMAKIRQFMNSYLIMDDDNNSYKSQFSKNLQKTYLQLEKRNCITQRSYKLYQKNKDRLSEQNIQIIQKNSEKNLKDVTGLLKKILDLIQKQKKEYDHYVTTKFNTTTKSLTIQIIRKITINLKFQICIIKLLQLKLLSIIQTNKINVFYIDLEKLRREQFNFVEYLRNISSYNVSDDQSYRGAMKKQQFQVQKYLKKYSQVKKQLQQNQYNYDHWFHNSSARFHFPFYRFPVLDTLAIFIPSLVLGLVNLLILFQGVKLDSRLGNISTLLIAYVGMIAVMQTIIKAKIVTLTQYIIYSSTVISLIIMFYSVGVFQAHPQSVTSEKVVYDDQVFKNGAFYVSLFFVSLNFVYPFVMIIFHKCVSEKRYRNIQRPLYKAHESKYNLMPGTTQTQIFLTKNELNIPKIERQIQNIPYMITEKLMGCLQKALEESYYQNINKDYKQKTTLHQKQRLSKKQNKIRQDIFKGIIY